MLLSRYTKCLVAVCGIAGLLGFARLGHSAQDQTDKPSTETTTITVVVKEYDSGQAIPQAHITLEFFEPHGKTIPRKPKKIYYNAKTDLEGRCRLAAVNKGPIVLTVTEPGHQAYGMQLQIEKDNQVFEVRLKKPKPLL